MVSLGGLVDQVQDKVEVLGVHNRKKKPATLQLFNFPSREVRDSRALAFTAPEQQDGLSAAIGLITLPPFFACIHMH